MRPTYMSWDQGARLSVCQKERRHHRLHHPPRRSRLSHTGRCCLTAAGMAVGKKIMIQEKQQIKAMEGGRLSDNFLITPRL